MDSPYENCKSCKSSAWCLSRTWPEEALFTKFTKNRMELVTQIVKCDNCGRFSRVLISQGVGDTVTTNFQSWDVRPCERNNEEEFGHAERCTECLGMPEKVELPMRNNGHPGQLVITIRHG